MVQPIARNGEANVGSIGIDPAIDRGIEIALYFSSFMRGLCCHRTQWNGKFREVPRICHEVRIEIGKKRIADIALRYSTLGFEPNANRKFFECRNSASI